ESLGSASNDQRTDSGSETAPRRSRSEDDHAHDENASSPIAITQRTADKKKRRKEQGIGFDYPLDVGNGGVERALQRGQGDVDNSAVDKRHARSEDRGREHPGLRSFTTGRSRCA